ncbi:hypothetical protein [Streptomyces sp. NPDC006368]|uniref:hypothetical protein n=1 Tax=Streptomyces sp. NPDC006368 TaxID=3156760 RepID=UPI0033A00BB8
MNLGLIKSTDAGKSWQTTSLKGEADFHALEHAKGTDVRRQQAAPRVAVEQERLSTP